jgi:hypothetical protein
MELDELRQPSGRVLSREKTMKPYEKCLERFKGLSKWWMVIKSEVATAMMIQKEI